MKAFSEGWNKQDDCQGEQPQRLSARLERTWTPQWSSASKTWTAIRSDSKGAQQGRARAATLAVDTRLRGDRKLLHAKSDVSVPLARVSCECRLRGSRTCTANCPCLMKWKSCGVECECHGFCCNSFFHTPRLSIRNGALEEELYTKSDLPRYRIAFVVCGRIMTVPEYWRYHEKLLHRPVRHYGFVVSWPGACHGLPGNPDLDKYTVDPFDDMTGAVNHSCEPNVVLEACWANGKLYCVGRTARNIMAKEALTVDYKWIGTGNPREFAEICRCREALCRGLIARKDCSFFELSTSYYDAEITRRQEQHAITEKTLHQRYEELATAKRVGPNTVDLEMNLIRKENEQGKLKASVELMIAAVARSRASLSKGSWMPTVRIVETPKVKKSHISLMRKFMQKICFLMSRERRENEEQLAQATIETSESNPYFVPDSGLSSYRIAPAPSARSSMERLGSCTPRSVSHPARGPHVPRLALPPRPRPPFSK